MKLAWVLVVGCVAAVATTGTADDGKELYEAAVPRFPCRRAAGDRPQRPRHRRRWAV
jgi:hypothetical protein